MSGLTERLPEGTILPQDIRQPVAAGQFYPAKSEVLNTLVDSLLQEAQPIPSSGKRQILLVPHAGIYFSGATAAAGFRQVAGKDYGRVIILGASHRYHFSFAAIDTHQAWQTPLGLTRVHGKLAESLSYSNLDIELDNRPHNLEYSLEMALIFLQKTLPDSTIVPILVSRPTDRVVTALSRRISERMDHQTLLVVSSDLSHYPTYRQAQKIDQETIDTILSGSRRDFEMWSLVLEQKYPRLTLACGAAAIRIALQIADNLGLTNFDRLKYQNSGDIQEKEKRRVVGYTAISAWKEKEPESLVFSYETQTEALAIARKTLTDYLIAGEISDIPCQSPELMKAYGVYVTLKKDHKLCGCVGVLNSQQPLYQLIQRITLLSAAHDSRFAPLQPDELNKLAIEVSILTPTVRIRCWQDIQPGQHGVHLRLGNKAAVYLPQVAAEEKWNSEQLLYHLCLKAEVPEYAYHYPAAELSIFRTAVIKED